MRGADQRSKWLLVGGLCAAGAALTKQMGLYVAAVYPLLVWIWLRERPIRAFVRTMFQPCLIIAILVAPWYIYKSADIRSGRDANNTLQLVLDCHAGRNLPQRMLHAGAEVTAATTLPGGLLLLAAVAASLGDRRVRRLLGLFVVPLGLLWAAAFSYDLRNLAMLVPLVGMAAGIGLVRIVFWIEGWTGRLQLALCPLPLSPSPPSPRLFIPAGWPDPGWTPRRTADIFCPPPPCSASATMHCWRLSNSSSAV